MNKLMFSVEVWRHIFISLQIVKIREKVERKSREIRRI